MDTYKLEVGSVSTLLDNILQPIRHTLHHVAQNLDFRESKGILALFWNVSLWMCFGTGQNISRPLSLIFNWSLMFLSGIPDFHSSMAALFSALENGFTPGGIMLADWLLWDRDDPIYTCAK